MEDFMKNLFIVFGFVFLATFNAVADEYALYTGNAYTYNDVWKNLDETQFQIKYDDSEKVYYLFTADWMNKIWIYLSDNDLQTIRNVIAKYQDWVKIAKEKNAEINKEVPNSTIRTKVVWKFGDDWYSSSRFILSFSVLSQNSQRHELVISSNKVTSSSNQFVDVKLDTLYFEEKDVIDFLAGINENKISELKIEHNKKKESQDLFN